MSAIASTQGGTVGYQTTPIAPPTDCGTSEFDYVEASYTHPPWDTYTEASAGYFLWSYAETRNDTLIVQSRSTLSSSALSIPGPLGNGLFEIARATGTARTSLQIRLHIGDDPAYYGVTATTSIDGSRSSVNPATGLADSRARVNWSMGDGEAFQTPAPVGNYLGFEATRMRQASGTANPGSHHTVAATATSNSTARQGGLQDGATAHADVDVSWSFTVLVSDSPITGLSQDDPVLPEMTRPDGSMQFANPLPGLWYDPPAAHGFDYALEGGEFFSVGTPSGLGFGPVQLVVGGAVLGTLNPGDAFAFAPGVSAFSLLGLNPMPDLDDPLFAQAYPVLLDFAASAFNLTITPIVASVPAPATPWLMLAAAAVLGLRAGRRRYPRLRKQAVLPFDTARAASTLLT